MEVQRAAAQHSSTHVVSSITRDTRNVLVRGITRHVFYHSERHSVSQNISLSAMNAPTRVRESVLLMLL